MKEQLRQTLLSHRRNLRDTEVHAKSRRIIQRLWSLQVFSSATTIMHYISYDNEVFTHDLIKDCLTRGKIVVVPVTRIHTHTVTPSILYHWDDLQEGPYGILEPKKEAQEEISLGKIDVFLVPGVGFDRKGGRLGHGMGYYDTLLQKATGIPKIGLAFSSQIVDQIPMDTHDVAMDYVVTEHEIIHCKPS
jgi:5-formyltetrahydrofolate cyclo-ligase